MMRSVWIHTEPWIYRLMLLSFFLPHKVQTFIFIFFAAWVVMHAIHQRVFLTRSQCFIALLLGGGYLFYIAYLPLTPGNLRHIVYSLLERKVALLLLPFIIPLAVKMSQTSFRGELKYFAIANIIHGIIINLFVLYTTLQGHSGALDHVYYRTAFETAAGIHPTYYGMYCCFSLGIILTSLPSKGGLCVSESGLSFQVSNCAGEHKAQEPSFGGQGGALRAAAQVLLILFILLLSPKISLLIAALLYAYYFFFELKWKLTHKMMLFASSLLTLILLFFFIPFFHQRIAEVWHFISGQPGTAIDNSMVFRKLIFDIDLNILKESWLFGIGPARLQQHLDLSYAILWNISGVPVKSYNTHNEFLNQWICFGLGGLLYFIMVFAVHLRRAYRRTDKIYFFTTFIIMITCLTENVLSRQQGVLFAALMLAIFYFEHEKESNPTSDIPQ